MSLRPLLDRLDAWLVKHRPRFHAALRPGATADELARMQTILGRPIPESLRELLAWHNGQGRGFVGAFEDAWLLMGSDEIATAGLDIEDETGLIPFLDNDAGDYLCLDATMAEAPVCAFWLGQEDRPVVADSLAGWLSDFAENVEKGNYHEEPERGWFLRAPHR